MVKGNILADFAANPQLLSFAAWAVRRAAALTDEDRDRCIAAIKTQYPAWDGKAEEINDLPALWRHTGIKIDKDTHNFDSTQNIEIVKRLPETAGKEMIDLSLWVCAKEVRGIAKQYFDGLSVNESLAKTIDLYVSSVDAKRKGGKATRKWTADIEQKARAIFDECKRGRMSNDAAYKRTAGRLKTEHGISISRATLQRHLRNGSTLSDEQPPNA